MGRAGLRGRRRPRPPAHRPGLRRLLRFPLPTAAAPTDLRHRGHRPARRHGTGAAAEALVTDVVWDEAGWSVCAATPRAGARPSPAREGVAAVLKAEADVRAAMERRGGDALRETRLDVARQLGRLLHPGWVTDGRRRPPPGPRALPPGRRAAPRARAGRLGRTATACARSTRLGRGPDPWARGAARQLLRSGTRPTRGHRRAGPRAAPYSLSRFEKQPSPGRPGRSGAGDPISRGESPPSRGVAHFSASPSAHLVGTEVKESQCSRRSRRGHGGAHDASDRQSRTDSPRPAQARHHRRRRRRARRPSARSSASSAATA